MNSSFFDVDSSESSRQLAFTTSDEYLYEDRDDTQELQQNDFTATQSAGVSGESWCVTESDTCTQPANLVGHTNACDSLRSLHQSHLQCVQNVASEVDVTCDTLTYESQQWPISQEDDVTAERVSDSPPVHEQTHHNTLDSTLGLPESEDEDELSNLIMVANDDDDDECDTSTANIECGEAGESLSPINDELVGTVPSVRRAGGRGAMSDHDDAVEHHPNSSVRAKSAKQQSSRMSAYLLWASEMRESAIQQNPHMDFAQINKRLGAMWNSLSEAKKFSYKRKAQRLNRSAAAAASGVVDSDGLSCGPPTGATLSGCAKMKSTGRWASSRHQTDTVASSLTNNTSSTSTEPLDLAAHLLLLGESLSVVGRKLCEREGRIAVSGALSVVLDSALCALVPLTALTRHVPQLSVCPRQQLSEMLDNVAYFMPGL